MFVRNTSAALVTYGPIRYLQTSDSPWYQGIQNGTMYLEDFKDGLLNTPFVIGSGAIRGPGDKRSVDADDGVLDGRGQDGGTWGATPGGSQFGTFEFNFARNQDGLLPAFIGLVVTKESEAFERFTIYDDNRSVAGVLNFDLTPLYARSGPDFVFDSSEARFIGVYSPDGISRITLRWATMVDHLQYGYALPEPSGAMLACVGFALLVTHRRRQQIPFFT